MNSKNINTFNTFSQNNFLNNNLNDDNSYISNKLNSYKNNKSFTSKNSYTSNNNEDDKSYSDFYTGNDNKDDYKNESDKDSNSIQNSQNSNSVISFDEAILFLVEGCLISHNILDEQWNCDSGWRIGEKNGPPGYLKNYYPPIGWVGIGLKVASLYDNGDNTWLGNDNCQGEWYIGYHGVKTIEAIQGICYEGFRRGWAIL